MYSRVRLVLLAVALALLACAHARPGDNDINQNDTKISNVASAKTEKVKAGNKTEPLKSVNERFPSAVLFGDACSGTIISPKWILTAGHCTLLIGNRYIIAGTNNSEDETAYIGYIKRLVIHPLFSVGPYWLNAERYDIKQVAVHWDFLLAELEEPLPLDGKIMAAAKLDDQASLPDGLEVGYAGYSVDHFGGFMRSEMHDVELAKQPDSVCSTLIQYNPEDMLCANGVLPYYTVCNLYTGVSGSGLISNGRLVGVASWSENDEFECHTGSLVVFARVASARKWIKQVTGV